MPNELKIVIDADVQKAVNGLKQIDKEFAKTASDAQKFGTNVTKGTQAASASLAKLPNTASSATFALTNLGRVAQDLPFGFLGIANNITPLIESFQRLSVSAKETGVSVGKQLLDSLKGGGGLILGFSLLSSALSLASVGFSAFTRSFGGAGKAAKDAAEDIRSVSDVINDATDSTQGEIARINALAKAATDSSNSFKVQQRAIQDLQKINKSYFGDLEAGKSTYEQITGAANAYTEALVQQAIVKGLQEEISKVAKQLREAKKEYFNAADAATFYNKALDKAKSSASNEVKGLAAVNNSVVEAQTEADKYNKKLTESANVVQKLGTQFNELVSEIDKSIGVQLKLKPLDEKPFKDSTDEIIARAKLAVEALKEAFVVPDLEITFFRNKDAVLKDAKKFLNDIKSFLQGDTGALKVKLPVITEFDFLPVQEGIQQDVIDNFFKTVGTVDLNLPVNVTPDISVSKEAIDKINKKLDLEKQFKVLGKSGLEEFNKIFKDIGATDFTKLNEGLEEATKKLQNMMALAQTLNQAIGQGLTSAFNSVFDAILEGKSVFKALAEGIKQLIVGTIKAIAQMLILKAVSSFIFPGGAGVGSAGGAIARGIFGGAANFGSLSGIGSRAFQNVLTVNVVGNISGDTIRLAGQRAANSAGRFGG